jgi:hypothetical protein
MRDFVRNILPQVRSRSPQLLNARAELELEQEIENENATVVGGDGVETKTGMEGVNDELGARESSESESEDEKGLSRKEYPSWKRSRKWPLVPVLPSPHEEAQERKNERRERRDSAAIDRPTSPISPTPSITSTSDTGASQLASGLRRIRSAVSLVVPVGGPHHCKPSPFESRRAGPDHIRLPTVQPMSKMNSPPPSPSLRRSNASHPDIASLVENWSHSGPANQTLLYKT